MDDQRACGGCGKKITEKNERKEYNSLCSSCPIPHMCVGPIGNGRHRCDYCGQEGHNINSTDCTHVYTKCEHCGEHPFCAKDCSGIAAILSNPDNYVIGFQSGD